MLKKFVINLALGNLINKKLLQSIHNARIFFKTTLNTTEKFKNKYFAGKNIPDETNKVIAKTPEKELN